MSFEGDGDGGESGERTNFRGGVGQAVQGCALASRGLPHEADERVTTHCVASGKVAQERRILRECNCL